LVKDNNTTSTNNKQLSKTVNIMYETIKNYEVSYIILYNI